MDGTDHVVPSHEESSPDDTEDKRAPECPDEPLNSLLRGKCNQRSSTEEFAPNVGKAIVTDDERRWHPEPDQTLEDVVDDEVATSNVNTNNGKGGRSAHLENTMIKRLICTQQNNPNCCLRYPLLSDITKPIKPMMYNMKLIMRWLVAKGSSWASAKTTC
jgi:hypothetical protein